LNTLDNIKEQHLDLFQKCPIRERKLIQFRMTDASLRVAYDSISFLLTTKNPTLILDVQAAEQSYISDMESLTWRNDAYEKLHMNSKLEKIDNQTGQCSIRIDFQIKELHKAGKLLYPKKEFLQIAGRK